MLRKLLSVALLALGIGLGATAHPAQGASYAGGASNRICPVPQDCCGHIQYQLQRQTVLQNVQETVYDTQQVPCVRTVCETVMQPRTVTTVRNVVEEQVREEPYTIQRPVYRTIQREVHYTVQRPVTRTVWKDVTYTVCRPVRETHFETRSYTVSRPVRETSFKTCTYNVSRPVREVGYKDVTLHGLPAGAGDRHEDGQLHGLPAGPGDLLQDLRLHGLPAGPVRARRGASRTRSRCPVQQTVMQCQPATEMVPVRQCAYKQVPYTVCRQVSETVTAGMPVHGAGPGPAHRDAEPPRTPSAGRCARPSAGVPLHGLPARPDDHLQDGQPRRAIRR